MLEQVSDILLGSPLFVTQPAGLSTSTGCKQYRGGIRGGVGGGGGGGGGGAAVQACNTGADLERGGAVWSSVSSPFF